LNAGEYISVVGEILMVLQGKKKMLKEFYCAASRREGEGVYVCKVVLVVLFFLG
jgi:hypothetical protein